MQKKLAQLSNFFLSSVHRTKFWILIVGSLVATLPFSFVVAITVDSKLQTILLLRRWILYIYVPVLTLLFPLVTSMMMFLDLESSQVIQDLLVLPVNRKKLFSIGFSSHIFLNLLLGLFIGWFLYFLTNITSMLMFSHFYVPINMILSITLVLLFYSIIYGGLTLILAFLFDPKRSEVYFPLFFLVTFIWDLIFWSIGGDYAKISYTYYKLVLFHLFLTNSLLKLQVKAMIPVETNIFQYLTVIIGICSLIYYFTMRLFEKKEY